MNSGLPKDEQDGLITPCWRRSSTLSRRIRNLYWSRFEGVEAYRLSASETDIILQQSEHPELNRTSPKNPLASKKEEHIRDPL
ncbi:hypothetical protein J6590_072785 [Homalodisca vitripennis]|nr:hypothetical protein J6590_072785 [Homalodisca vitripennis]